MGNRPAFSFLIGLTDVEMDSDGVITDRRCVTRLSHPFDETPVVIPTFSGTGDVTYDRDNIHMIRLLDSHKKKHIGGDFTVGDIFSNMHSETNGGILGYKCSSLYADTVLYALASLHTQYLTDGNFIFKQLTFDEALLSDSSIGCYANSYKHHLHDGMNDKGTDLSEIGLQSYEAYQYSKFVHWGMNTLMAGFISIHRQMLAHWVFTNVLHMDIKPTDLKHIFAWEWG